MLIPYRALACAPVLLAVPAHAEDDAQRRPDVVVTAERRADTPASQAGIDADAIRTTVNAQSTEDILKYLPSLILRKRNPGDTQAVLATRTSGLGASARSLVYADGALLSALIGNNNSNASPRWGLVSPQEIARVDVLYGPFSAAYPGNSIGAVVNITTRVPERLEATADYAVSVQRFEQYATKAAYPTYRLGATVGDRFGPLALFASYEHLASDAQPLTFVTAIRPTNMGGAPAAGGVDDLNRTGQPIRVLGAGQIPHQLQDRFKLEAALDVAPGVRLIYVGAAFLNDTDANVATYLASNATGLPVYAGTVNLEGRAYTLAPNAFSGQIYRLAQRHWSHSLSATGASGRVEWQAIGTLYDYAHDVQRSPTVSLPGATQGGAGTITRLDGTGWLTLDGKLGWHAGGGHLISAGAHVDRYTLASDRYLTADWLTGAAGALDLRSAGRTRTAAVWAEDAWSAGDLTLTLGGRQEWWKAYRGVNYTRGSPQASAIQPTRAAERFSPKATLAYSLTPALTVRLSYGEAWRFPTVGELYQAVTTPIPAVPNPNLRPEHARSEELALEHRDARGLARLAIFNESVADALISQTGPLNGTATLATFVQNVDRTRARGVEAVVDRTDVVRGVDLQGSVTYSDATVRADAAFPAAIGKRLASVSRWKATLVGTWRPAPGVSLTAAGRYASRMYGTIDNSDVVGNTYQGFYKYLVVDLRATVRAGERLTFGIGVDNVNNDRYFLFHPFTQRTFQADVRWRL